MNILLTSVGRRTYMIDYFKHALKDNGLVHASNSDLTYSMKIADKFVVTPSIYDSTYIDFLISYCVKNDIKAIISLFDIDLPILAKNKEEFLKNEINVVISDYEITQLCNDKWLTFNFLKENKFNVPVSCIKINECKKLIEKRVLKFPLILKPRWGMGSIGIYEADNLNELEILYNIVKRIILNSYLKFEAQIDMENCVIIQEKLNGVEYGLDILNDLKGKFINSIPKLKLAMRAGETDGAIIVENNHLFNLAKKLSDKLKHVGNLDVDCFKVGNEFYILEMNCRFGGQYPFSHLAGVDFPKAIINMLENKKIENDLVTPKVGVNGIKEIVLKIYE